MIPVEPRQLMQEWDDSSLKMSTSSSNTYAILGILQSVAQANAGQARMLWQGLVQVVAQIPAHAEPVGGQPHELTFRADALEEHHQLEPEVSSRTALPLSDVDTLGNVVKSRDMPPHYMT